MKSKPFANSVLETECLFGETIEVLDENLDWVYCKLTTDNYYGWVKKVNIGKLRKATHRVLNIRTFIFKNPDAKSETALYLPMGSNLVVEKIRSNWAEIYFLVNNMIEVRYVPAQHIVELKHNTLDWVGIAENLEGTPYKWGGRDTIGIDCSALLQLAYQTYGEKIPRNTSHQIQLKKSNILKLENLYRGCVVFWEGHVAIMIDKENCIHANAFHMKTVVEPLSDVVNRMYKNNKIVKMMDFN
jgi:cell wall-associated NlpC family hydrolase